MIVDIISLLVTCTVIPALSIGFMACTMVTQYRLEKRFEQMREERRLMRAEIDSVRTRLKAIEIAKKEEQHNEQQRQSADNDTEKKEDGNSTAGLTDPEAELRDRET